MFPLFEDDTNRRTPSTHADTPQHPTKLVAGVVRSAAAVMGYPHPRDGHASRERGARRTARAPTVAIQPETPQATTLRSAAMQGRCDFRPGKQASATSLTRRSVLVVRHEVARCE
jgi:hypothetical protein